MKMSGVDKLRSPLIEGRHRSESASQSAQSGDLRDVLESAIEKTIQSDNAIYDRLPVPVRYRATGAINAWKQVRASAGLSGADFSARLAVYPILPLLDNFPRYVDEWLRRSRATPRGAEAAAHIHRSLVWQAFSACDGVLYEPTPALHRLLDAAYIADDVPVGMIALPTRAMCIIPDPSWWGRQGGIEALALFRHERDADDTPRESLSCVTWTHHRGPERHIVMDVLQISLADPGRTIKAMFDEGGQSLDSADEAEAVERSRKHWEGVLDYAIKMLLYLTVRDAHIIHDRSYSDAPRSFSGLGKRKRAERLAQIELLYDRHIVGPAILDCESIASIPDGSRHEVRGHWRRPHFRMQPHGPQSSLRKLGFIGATIVRPDRIGL
ncbi:hypothetical protein J2797_006213 [Paraburkholderia terricola]|uniref:hypothetical protein n=1 Tax=Paraburkholderia terricola TaxID=169427 RepID=UPI002866BA42|nr:hypothetical protein [Paraburkholderia terricola]MDR6496286.1 hypothetical protein [Paraburkholderia terricola]